MSNAPNYIPASPGVTQQDVVNGVMKDGLTDAYGRKEHMGMKGEACARVHKIDRAEQDDFAAESYARASLANENGWFRQEIVSVKVSLAGQPPLTVEHDELLQKVRTLSHRITPRL